MIKNTHERAAFWGMMAVGIIVVLFAACLIFSAWSARQINTPQSVFSMYRAEIIAVSLIFVMIIVFMVLMALEILRRQRVEASLQKSEEQYSTLIENINIGIVMSTLDGQFLHVNAAIVAMGGYGSREEFMRVPARQLYADAADRQRMIAELRTHGFVRNLEFRSVRKDQSIYWTSISAVLLQDQHGQATAILGSINDITDRKRAEEELQQYRNHLEELIKKRTEELAEERNLLRILIDNIPDLILVKDTESRFLLLNQALAHLMGAESPADLLGTTDFDFYPPEIAQQYSTLERAIIESGQPLVNREELHVNPDTGEDRWFLATKIPFRDQQGAIRGLVGISRDITERRQVEEELRRHRNHLEELVKERTAELRSANAHLLHEITDRKRAEETVRQLNADLENRVQQRTRQLEAAMKELQSFAYVVSHDLKTPLRGIAQLAHWMVEDYTGAFDDKGKEMVALLIDRVKHMDRLIDGILQYSRVGRISEEERQIDLTILVKASIDLIAPPPQIRITVAAPLPVVFGDEIRLEQVFQNLLDNAVKFLDKPEGIITIGCEDMGTYWTFRIADNGPGIDAKYHEKIFQLFQTLASHDTGGSTGIGLAVAKKIVEFYGGKIWVESTPGQGSTFFFTLPKR